MQDNCVQDTKQVDYVPANNTADHKRLVDAQAKVALLVVENPIYLPIFERIELELSALNAQSDAVSRARLIASRHQMALA